MYLTFPPLDRRPGTRSPTCPDCGAAWQRGVLHACLPPVAAGWWARLLRRVRLWHSPPVEVFVVFDDEVPRPTPPSITSGRMRHTLATDQSVPGLIVVTVKDP